MNNNNQPAPYSNSTSGTLLGETVWFTLPINTRIGFTALRDNLDLAGLDKDVAKALPTSYAFVRAIRKMAAARLVDEVHYGETHITFQISSRVKGVDGVDYVKDHVLTLDRASGDIKCADAGIKAIAEQEVNVALGLRLTSDVTSVITRLLAQHQNQSTFPMKGGVWFVTAGQLDLVDKLEGFVQLLGGFATRWPIYDGGSVRVQTQVQTVVVDSLKSTLEETTKYIEEINSSSSSRKLETARAKLEQGFLDLAHNATMIGNKMAVLEDALAFAEALLQRRQAAEPVVVTAPFKPEDGGVDEGPEAGEALPEGAIYLPPSTPAQPAPKTMPANGPSEPVEAAEPETGSEAAPEGEVPVNEGQEGETADETMSRVLLSREHRMAATV